MRATNHDEAKRTSPLALWRYAHDYLRAAQTLVSPAPDRLPGIAGALPRRERGLTFTSKRTCGRKGATMAGTRPHDRPLAHRSADPRRSAGPAPRFPPQWRAAVAEVAACCQEHQFVYLTSADSAFIDVEPLVDAGVWILDRIAPDVAEHYVRHLAEGASPSDAGVRRPFARRSARDLGHRCERKLVSA